MGQNDELANPPQETAEQGKQKPQPFDFDAYARVQPDLLPTRVPEKGNDVSPAKDSGSSVESEQPSEISPDPGASPAEPVGGGDFDAGADFGSGK